MDDLKLTKSSFNTQVSETSQQMKTAQFLSVDSIVENISNQSAQQLDADQECLEKLKLNQDTDEKISLKNKSGDVSNMHREFLEDYF